MQQKAPVKPEPAKVAPVTKRTEPQDQNAGVRDSSASRGATMELEDLMNATREEENPKQVETIQTRRGRRRKGIKRPNSMEVDPNTFKEKFISHLSDNRIMTRRHIQGLATLPPVPKQVRGKPSLVMTADNKVNFDRYRKERANKMYMAREMKREPTVKKVQEQQSQKQVRKEISQMSDELKSEKAPSSTDLRGFSPNKSAVTHSFAVTAAAPTISAVEKPVVPKDAPAQNQITSSEKPKEIPYIPMTNIEVPLHLRNAWKTEVKPRARVGAAFYQPIRYPIPVPGVPALTLPPKRTIFDSNSEKYLNVFKTKPLIPEAPPASLIPQALIPPHVRDEDPLIVPPQNLPTSDPRLTLVPSFDYNPVFSDFNPSSERNKLSYQQTQTHSENHV